MFLLMEGERYHVLLHEGDDIWIISYDHPSEPKRLDRGHFDTAERIEAPVEYLEQVKKESFSDAQNARYRLIEPALADPKYIRERKARKRLFEEIAKREGTTVRRLQKLYNTYVATGVLTKDKPRPHKEREEFDWAIRKFYLSAKKNSLRTAYDMLILSRYTNRGGAVDEAIPSWDSFRQYYNRQWRSKGIQKSISRDGLTNYQRNGRMVYGSAMQWRSKIGSYQMDATQADIYLVSQFDRSKIIGRPNIVLAVDTATQLIAGIYIGLEAGEESVIACIANAVMDKMEYCKTLDIDLEPGKWPSCGVLKEIITDKGGEFLGSRIDEICIRYGIERHALPPFRPDEKGIVEKMFDLLQGSYKPALRGKGVIEDDYYERWATDYRTQAILTLREFTQIVVRCVIHLNSGRILEQTDLDAPRTPSALWSWYKEKGASVLMDADAEGVYRYSLPRAKAKFTRKGLSFHRMYYIPEDEKGLFVGAMVEVAYDIQNTDNVFMVRSATEFIPCRLAPASMKYSGCTTEELEVIRENEKQQKAELRRAETESRVNLQRNIRDIAVYADAQALSKGSVTDISRNRAEEKEKRS